MNKNDRQLSKFLSLVLRHKPETIGIELDAAGWVDVESLLSALNSHPAGRNMDLETLTRVVEQNDKQRFTFSDDGTYLRARQGHSVEVELGYATATPPEVLFHGTPEQSVDSIRESGLIKMKRHHVHLHSDVETSTTVGARRGTPVLLKIRSGEMNRGGFEFFVTENDVWLTDHVPPQFIEFPNPKSQSN